MIISHRYKFIFFSFPKTGSESVRASLSSFNEVSVLPWRQRNPFYPHMSPLETQRVFEDLNWDFESYRRISCVRNPFPRLVSLYRMICRVDGFWRNGLRPSFDTWIKMVSSSGCGGGGRPHQRWRQYGAWSARTWLYDANGRSLASDIIRLEDINVALPQVLAELALPDLSIPHLNPQSRVDWATWYDTQSVQHVKTKYSWDLKCLGYSTPRIHQPS